ncbi:MAG TPA: hypothetical protein VMD91_08030 [Candidatus Sulfotelmatobacter sp.]|nr:hypothetical protein [Candidatus Sulfotelmatobacter sp.]
MNPFVMILRAALCVALAGPLLGAGTPDAGQVIAAMNRDGLAHFAQDDPGHVYSQFVSGDETVSPLLDWSRGVIRDRAGDDATRSVLARLRRSGITIDALVRWGVPANADAAETTSVAKLAGDLRSLGVTFVQVDDPPIPRHAGLILIGDFTRDADVRIATDDALPPFPSSRLQSDVPVLTWFFDDIRAARFDTTSGRRSLFLFWGTHEKLAAMRKHLNPERWVTLTSGFVKNVVGVSDLGIDTIASVAQIGMQRSARLLVSRDRVAVQLREQSWHVFPGTYDPGNAPHYDELPMAPSFLYAVVDDDTGAIILLGEHT